MQNAVTASLPPSPERLLPDNTASEHTTWGLDGSKSGAHTWQGWIEMFIAIQRCENVFEIPTEAISSACRLEVWGEI
jgi:hypothetical protein